MKLFRFKYIIFLIALVLFFASHSTRIFAQSDSLQFEFNGSGTSKNPYQISSVDDLLLFSHYINIGYSFENVYFIQTNDIDLNNIDWTPIGSTDNYFKGVYDGNGNALYNLYINGNLKSDNSAFFNYLGGIIINLRIESGYISGKNCASFAYSSIGSNAKIINCYNKADFNSYMCGGIAFDFYDGVIANCINLGKIDANQKYGIVAVSNDVKIYCCYSLSCEIAPEGIVSTTSSTISYDELVSDSFAKKLSLTAVLSKYLFLGKYDVLTKEWYVKDLQLTFSEKKHFNIIIYFINYWFLPLCLLLFLFIIKHKLNDITFIKDNAIICGILSFFLDTAIIFKNFKGIKIPSYIFIVAINVLFAYFFIKYFKMAKNKTIYSVGKYIQIVIILTVFLELLQFRILPRYDGNIYYGSLIKATQIFNLDFISFIGSFVCWKWIHGLALFVAPFEFILPGQTVGLYIANVIITIITIVLLYRCLGMLYYNMTDLKKSLYCIIFVFSPYILGMFTYFSLDWHITNFSIWLIYAVINKNDFGISLCGLLLCFTKITSVIFYITILFSYFIYKVFIKNKHNVFVSLFSFLTIKRVILWISPTILLLLSMKYSDYVTTQSFYGAYDMGSMISLFDKNQIMNSLLQTFVFGFRWLIMILFTISIFKLIINKNKSNKIVNKEYDYVIWGTLTSILFTFLLLCVYKSDANCPRYTSIFSSFYIVLLPYSIEILFRNHLAKKITCYIIATIFIVQTYYTIDPSIINYSLSIDTGKKQIYKLSYKYDNRLGMNLGCDFDNEGRICSRSNELICDLFAYNLEHTFYESLIDKVLNHINPTEDDNVYVLDIDSYEINIAGRGYGTYWIYWDKFGKKRTYQFIKDRTIKLKVQTIKTSTIKDNNMYSLPSRFYLIVPYRIDSTVALEELRNNNYYAIEEFYVENSYGFLKLYNIVKE